MESVINNPLKMDRIRQRISQELLKGGNEEESTSKKAKKDRKKEKKEQKKNKKESKKRSLIESKSGHDDDDDDGRNKRHRPNDKAGRPSRSRSRSRSSSDDSKSNDNNSYDDRQRSDRGRYGLVNKKQQYDRRAAADGSLGPSEKLLQEKQRKQAEEEALRRKNLERRDVKQLSEEEKARRLREMQQDAELVDRTRAQRLGQRKDKDDNDRQWSKTTNASFLGDMRTEAYVQSYERGIKDRLDQNKHYSQRSIDLNSDGFMRR